MKTTAETIKDLNREVFNLVMKQMSKGMTIDQAKEKVFTILERDFPDVISIYINQDKLAGAQ